MKILLRPMWCTGESWTGYLLRLATVNHAHSVRQLSKRLDMPIGELLLGPVSVALARLGIDHATVPQVQMPMNADQAPQRLRKASRPRLTAVCPECLRSDACPHYRSSWDSPLMNSCALHGLRLIATCPRCHRPIRTRDGPFLRCPCGVPFSRWRADLVDHSAPDLREILNLPEAANDELTFQPPSEKEWAAFSLLRNLAYESGWVVPRPHDKVPRLSNPTDRLEILRLVSPWFQDWPDSFARTLERSSWTPGYTGAKHLGRHALQLAEFPQVAEVVDQLVKKRAAVRREQRRYAQGYEHPEMMSLPIARLALGITQRQSSQWVAAGVFGQTWLERERGHRVRVVERKAVTQLKVILTDTLSLRDASRRLGLSMRAVSTLVNSGVLSGSRLQSHVCTARVNPKDLDVLGARVLGSAMETQSLGRARPLGKVIYGVYVHAGPNYVRALFVAFDSGELPLLRQSSSPPNLSSLHVPRLELRRFYARVRREFTVPA